MRLNGKNVIVTGGAGVIGQALIKKLSDSGAEVKCFDLVSRPKGLKTAEYVKKDLVSLSVEDFTDFNPEAIFHLAATFERTEEEPDFWESNYLNNVVVTHKVIDASKKCKNLQRFVFASSYLIYSPSLYLFESVPTAPISLSERDIVNPRNLCGAAKYYAEKELNFLANTSSQFTSVSARIFRVYGCGSRDVISRWIRAGLRNESITVYGEENSFDYIFAGDVAEGLLKLGESEASGVVNLGTGVPSKIGDVVKNLTENIPKLKIQRIAKKIPTERNSADITTLKKETDWTPSIGIREGIKLVIDYERSLLLTKN